ncbi:MAG: formate dehydrogenase subunit alpha [Methanotrichaceae archaeon]|jgi:formate dehydrogenase major subunit
MISSGITFEEQLKEPKRHFIPTTCPYCGTGCSLYLVVGDNRVLGVEPWHTPPINEGKLCQKGRYANEFIHSKDRLTKPLIKKDGVFEQSTWDEAYQLVVKKFKSYRPEELGCLASAKASNEDNYLMQKFARIVLKTNNIDHCARLCHSSTVSGLSEIFGSGAMTNSILDLQDSNCIFVIGSNTFEQHPLIGRRLILAKKKGAKIICADPRYTPTAKQADLYLPMYSGTDVALLNGLMHHIIKNGWENREFIENRTKGFDFLKKTAMNDSYDLKNVSKITGIPEIDLAKAAEWIAKAKPCALVYSMGITQHTVGVDNVKSVANLMMLTGNIGKPGSGVNPLRGQNNVQGACDMGCLPDVYSGYQKVTDEQSRRKMMSSWGADEIATNTGYTVTEMMDVLLNEPGKIKCMYLMGENPMLSDPDLNHVRKALENVEFMVSQEIFLSETAEFADVVLPAACFAEKNGTHTNTERRVQRLRKAVDPPGVAKPDWLIICEIAGLMGYGNQFSYKNESEIFDEIANVTPSYAGMNYERLEHPYALQWPCPDKNHPGTQILHKEKFATKDGLGVFTAVEWQPPAEVTDSEYPLILTTGRCIWHWHTGTMTRRSKTLDTEVKTGWAEINPKDAEDLGIDDREMVRVTSRRGEIEIPAKVTGNIKIGEVFIPFHFKECPANILTNNAVDSIAKIPEYKACAVKIEKIKGR